jgi:hypothetical protein
MDPDWQASVDKSELIKRFADFHPNILAVLESVSPKKKMVALTEYQRRKATEVKQWPLLYRAPIPVWQKGKMIQCYRVSNHSLVACFYFMLRLSSSFLNSRDSYREVLT